MDAKKIYLYLILISSVYMNVESIGGGDYIPITEAPYYISLPMGCGGAILSEYWIISAGHCLRFVSRPIKILSGRGTQFDNYDPTDVGVFHDVKKIIVHPDFEMDVHKNGSVDFLRNDIILMRLEKPLSFNEYCQPIKISRKALAINDTVTVVGLGNQRKLINVYPWSSPVLKRTQLIVTAADSNRVRMLPFGAFALNNYTQVCPGDSGGPFTKDGQLVGIVSTGNGCRDWIGRHKNDTFSGFVRVDLFYDWIIKQTGIEY